MRIDGDQKIAGFPAIEIRRLMRDSVSGQTSLRQVRERLSCSKAVANAVLADLQREGFLSSADSRVEVSLKGIALAQATAAKPLLRSGAERLLSELVQRAKLINADDGWAYRVDTLAVFGSFAKGAERPNDVDVACKLVPRWNGEAQREAEQRRREVHISQFRSIVHCVYWPQHEIVRFLKARSRGLSIHAWDDLILKQDKHEVIFRDCGETG